MNLSKIIDISKSSLIGLKAELLKKQEEVNNIKASQGDSLQPSIKPNKFQGFKKTNKGIEERCMKDTDHVEESGDYEILRKSRTLLEEKTKLYDKLKRNEGGGINKEYLIDFDLKKEIYSRPDTQDVRSNQSEDETVYSDSNSDPENDWVDFVDTLGRSRRCLKKDVAEMKAKDESLAASLKPPSPPPPTPEPTPELLSWDMQREIMRKKWEEKECLLLEKNDIHYQDVLFDEARPHGVGYYGFSTDEAERVRQQQDLKNIRKETKEQQEAAVGLRVHRQQQMEARLAAARRRKRERLGLPPDSPEAETKEDHTVIKEEEPPPENIEELEQTIKKSATVRPWDIGKDEASSVMTQEEWVEKKRSERPQEFAPPSILSVPTDITTPSFKKRNKNKQNENITLPGTNQNSSSPAVCGSSSRLYNHSSGLGRKDSFIVEGEEKSSRYIQGLEKFNLQKLHKKCNDSNSGNILENNLETKYKKPTLQDIDNLLSKTQEKYYCPNKSESSKLENKIDRSHPSTTRENCSTSSLPATINRRNIIINEVDTDSDGQETNLTDQHSVGGTNVGINMEARNNKRKWAEIPPPMSISYYNDSAKQRSTRRADLSESISVGLNFLKSKEQKTYRVKGLLDIV